MEEVSLKPGGLSRGTRPQQAGPGPGIQRMHALVHRLLLLGPLSWREDASGHQGWPRDTQGYSPGQKMTVTPQPEEHVSFNRSIPLQL